VKRQMRGFLGVCLGGIVSMVSTLTYAIPAGTPVYDEASVAKLAQEVNTLSKQLDDLDGMYRTAKDEYDRTGQIQNELQGKYGYGGLLDGANDFAQRNWSPNTWDDALNGVAGGNQQRYNELKKSYDNRQETLTQTQYEKGSSKENAKDYQNQVNVNKTATVQGSYSFDDIKKHLDTIHQLTKKIDETTNAKAALDLNARLMAEVAYISTQQLKMQTIINQQIAQQGSSQITSETENAKFNQLPDNY